MLTTAEAHVLIECFDQAERHSFEQARELTATLLKQWLTKYKFKDWVKTRTRGLRVTKRMRERRAAEIARQLNDNRRWHSHYKYNLIPPFAGRHRHAPADFGGPDDNVRRRS